MLTEHTLEIRHRPNSVMLDHRGKWAAIVSKAMDLSEWKIIENRVDFRNPDKSIRAFVSFRNFGITVVNQQTHNFFEDKAKKFVKVVTDLSGFDVPLLVERLGVRAKTCSPYDGEFSVVADQVRDKLFNTAALAELGGGENVVDVAAVMYFKTIAGQINANLSANTAEQLKRLFPTHEDLPAASWTADMDYFTQSPQQMSVKNVTKTISEFGSELSSRYDAISKLIDLGA